MRGLGSDDAGSGRLGALRWALAQRTDDPIAGLTLIRMGAIGNRTWLCYMSVAKLAGLVGCDARTVQRKLRFLEVRGYIKMELTSSRRTRAYRLFPDGWFNSADGAECRSTCDVLPVIHNMSVTQNLENL